MVNTVFEDMAKSAIKLMTARRTMAMIAFIGGFYFLASIS
jgi:hypothetical protein